MRHIDIAPFERFTVSVPDEGRITCHRLGSGPGLIILHGMMEAWHSHIDLALALAATYTVILPNRRGRGESSPLDQTSNMAQAVADLGAVLGHTGAEQIFAVSAGGLIALEASLRGVRMQGLAVFDPSLCIRGAPSLAWLDQHEEELQRGDVAGALVTAMLGAEMGPALLRYLPRSWLKALTRRMLRADARSAPSPCVSMEALAETIGYDARLAIECADKVDAYAAIKTPLLLLGGCESPGYFRRGLDALHEALPAARRCDFSKMGHGGSGNSNRGGQPDRIAVEIHSFFGDRSGPS
jgi:pimeloyl-ACP methyl ester carboxylesterase